MIKKATGFINNFPEDDVLLVGDLLVSLMHSSYPCFDKAITGPSDDLVNGKVLPETYFISTQLPAFVGKFLELEGDDLQPIWAVYNGTAPNALMPSISDNLEWLLRLTEHGTLVQRYERRPMLVDNTKAILRFTVYLRSVCPLSAYVSKSVQVLTAGKSFTVASASFGDAEVHMC